METGVVKKLDRDRGFGFIKPDDGGPDIFVHCRDISGGVELLSPGEHVTFTTAPDIKINKPKAVQVRVY